MSGQRTQWNEATRVQMPALVHLTRIGFTYFGKITEDKAGTVYDPDTNILIEVFKSQFAKLNPERAGEAEAILPHKEKKTMDIKAQTYKLIDDLKAVCHNYGMGNDGNEYKVITQIFLYKFLNDKFGYEIKKKDSRIASAEKWETAYSELPEDDRLDLLDSLSPDIPRLYPEHLISTLWNQQAKGDFDLIFDSTMVDIADKNIDIFSTQTTKNTKIPLFEKLTNFVTDDAQRAPFARALVDKLVNFSFEDAFAESYDFFAGVFEYVIKDYNTNGGGVYAEYYTPHAIAVIMARLLVGDRQDLHNIECYDPAAGTGTLLVIQQTELLR